MRLFRLSTFTLVLSTLVMFTSSASAQQTLTPDQAKAKQAYALGVQAYIWGYPMVVMEKSRVAMTSSDHAVTPEEFAKTGKIIGPVNQVANAWEMLGPSFSAGSVCKQRHAV